jgi:hypothetical protein
MKKRKVNTQKMREARFWRDMPGSGFFFWSWNEVAGIVERAGTIFERLFPKGRANHWLTRLTRADTP